MEFFIDASIDEDGVTKFKMTAIDNDYSCSNQKLSKDEWKKWAVLKFPHITRELCDILREPGKVEEAIKFLTGRTISGATEQIQVRLEALREYVEERVAHDPNFVVEDEGLGPETFRMIINNPVLNEFKDQNGNAIMKIMTAIVPVIDMYRKNIMVPNDPNLLQARFNLGQIPKQEMTLEILRVIVCDSDIKLKILNDLKEDASDLSLCFYVKAYGTEKLSELKEGDLVNLFASGDFLSFADDVKESLFKSIDIMVNDPRLKHVGL